jgi:hypothetical protein
VQKKHFDLMPPNGAAPSMLHTRGIEEPKLPVKAFVFPAEAFLGIIKSLDGKTYLRQVGLPLGRSGLWGGPGERAPEHGRDLRDQHDLADHPPGQAPGAGCPEHRSDC